LATEAALACRDYGFDILGRRRLISLIHPPEPSLTPRRRKGWHDALPGCTMEEQTNLHLCH